MLKQRINLPTVTNANPTTGKTSVVTVPGGYRVHQLLLNITASTGTNLPVGNWIGDIRVKLGGKVQRLHSAAELNLLNKANGAQYGAVTLGVAATNYGQLLPIFFAEPWRNDNTQGQWLAWNSAPSRLIEVEVDCSAAPAGVAPVISVSAVAIVDTFPANPTAADNTLGLISKVFRSDYPAAQNLDITTLDKRDIYQGVFISAANITKAILKANGKARLATAACRKRVQRQRDAAAKGSPKQFNLVLQSEIPVTIPFSRPPRDQGSENSAPDEENPFPVRYLVEIESEAGWYPEIVCDSIFEAEKEAKRRLKDFKFLKWRVVPYPPPSLTKLKTIREMHADGVDAFRIGCVTVLNESMVLAYIKFLEEKPVRLCPVGKTGGCDSIGVALNENQSTPENYGR